MLMSKLHFSPPTVESRQTFHLHNPGKDAPTAFSERLPHCVVLNDVTVQQPIGLMIAWVERELA